MAPLNFRIGLEIEALFTPDDTKLHGLTLEEFAKQATTHYNSEIDQTKHKTMHADIGDEWTGPVYQDWAMMDDFSIVGSSKTKYAIEIVSPILFCDDPNPWYHEVQNMFSTMEKLGEFHSNKSCGFHLHVSPVEGAWTMPHLRRICLAIIHFEEAFEVILPEHRRGSQWIQNNRFDNSWLARLQDNETVQLINVCQTVAEIVGVMSPDRYYQWNFQNMQEEDGINTIEWRRPPGVSTIEECLVWSELCIDFLRSACRNDIDICGYGKDVAGLETFVRDGMIPGTSEERFLVPIFSGKSGRLQLRKQEKDDFDTLGHKAKDDEERTLRLRELRTWLNQN